MALIAHGDLPDQKQCETSANYTVRSLTINSVSVISLATIITNLLKSKKRRACRSFSVAGDRGRASNYVYGAAKSSVSTFLEGLSSRLERTGVSVITIKPGFVDTPMTETFEKGLLWVKPESIAVGITKCYRKTKGRCLSTMVLAMDHAGDQAHS